MRVRHNEREIEIDWNSRAITKHNISKFPNSQNPTAKIQTQNDYLALKNGIHNTQRERVRHNERERESWREIQPLQFAQHKHSEAICDYACWFVVFCACRFVVFLCKSMVMWWAMGKVRDLGFWKFAVMGGQVFCACRFVVFCACQFVVFLCKYMVMWWATGKVRD